MKEDTKLLKNELPNIDVKHLETPDLNRLFPKETTLHPPRIVLLYGSIRERSYSRFVTKEAAKILNQLGAETRVFDPRGLPQPDGAGRSPQGERITRFSALGRGNGMDFPRAPRGDDEYFKGTN